MSIQMLSGRSACKTHSWSASSSVPMAECYSRYDKSSQAAAHVFWVPVTWVACHVASRAPWPHWSKAFPALVLRQGIRGQVAAQKQEAGSNSQLLLHNSSVLEDQRRITQGGRWEVL